MTHKLEIELLAHLPGSVCQTPSQSDLFKVWAQSYLRLLKTHFTLLHGGYPERHLRRVRWVAASEMAFHVVTGAAVILYRRCSGRSLSLSTFM